MSRQTKIHLVAIDLDGTLLNADKQISRTSLEILRTAREQHGVRLVLATARPPRSVLPFYRMLDLDTPMINYNGALVHDPGTQNVLLHRPIQPRVAMGVVSTARELFPQILVSGEVLDRWCTDRIDPAYETETSRLFAPDQVAPIQEWLPHGVTKLLLHGPAEDLTQLSTALRTRFHRDVTMVQTENSLLQVMHITVSKLQALKAVCAELGLSAGEVMAIGDNANDVGMLRWAGVGVAMANAVPEALAAADYITDHHDADGAANAIHRLLLDGG